MGTHSQCCAFHHSKSAQCEWALGDNEKSFESFKLLSTKFDGLIPIQYSTEDSFNELPVMSQQKHYTEFKGGVDHKSILSSGLEH